MYILEKSKHVVVFGPIRVWADNGFVCVEDSRDISALSGKQGGLTQLHWRDAGCNLKGICDMLGTKTDGAMEFSDEWDRHMRFVEQVLPIIQKAKEQGAHDDESMNRAKARARKQTFIFNGSKSKEMAL